MRAALSDRTTRIRLLAWSYLDVAEMAGTDSSAANDWVSGEAVETRPPLRNQPLWGQGSYKALEQAVDALPSWAKLRFYVFYYRTGGPFKHDHKPHPVLGRVARLMPREVFVPAEVSEAAGFLASDAKTFSRG